MRRSSTWTIPLAAVVAVAAGSYILNASPSHERVAEQSTPAGVESARTESAFPAPETSVTVTRRGERMGNSASATAANPTEPDTAITSAPTQSPPAQTEIPPIASVRPPGPMVEPGIRNEANEPIKPRRPTRRKRHDQPHVAQATPLDPIDRQITQEVAPADQVEREAARRTAAIRREASRAESDPAGESGDAAAQIVSHLNDREMRDLMEGRMTTTEVANRIRYRGSKKSLRKAIEQLRDERSGHIRED